MSVITHEVVTDKDRLDHYLAKQQLCTSRSEAAKLIQDGYILVNQHKVKMSYNVKLGDLVVIQKPPVKMLDLVPLQMYLKILHEDEDIVVINKDAGIAVHPGAGNYDKSLVHGLLYHCKDLSGIGGVERPGIVHRLDKGTSGVMVVAKNDRAHQNLSDQFKNKTIKKTYHAICLGEIQKNEQRLVNFMKRSEMNRKRFVVNQKKGKEAITAVSVLQKNKRLSYVEVKPETGRTHQIRVHLSFMGHPIVGDEVYGGTKKLALFDEPEKQLIRGMGRFLLHAKELTLVHPKTQKEMSFLAAIPEDFSEFKKRFLEK